MRSLFIPSVIISVWLSPIGSSTNAQATELEVVPKYNCFWNAEKTANNFDAEDHLMTFEACSLFIRSSIIGSQWMGPLASSLMVGKESFGTLTFIANDGTKRTCFTLLKKAQPAELSHDEGIVAYLKAEIDGGALSPQDREKAQSMIRATGVDVQALTKKIDESIGLQCSDPAS